MQHLDLSHNNIKTIRFTLYKLEKLEFLDLEGNNLEFPFNQYSKSTNPARLIQFLKDNTNKTEKWPQLKLITLGHGHAGKVLNSMSGELNIRQLLWNRLPLFQLQIAFCQKIRKLLLLILQLEFKHMKYRS